jgi:hypothetical protein
MSMFHAVTTRAGGATVAASDDHGGSFAHTV